MFIYSLNYLRLVYRLFSLDQAGVGVSCCDRDPLRQLQGGGGPQHPLKSSTFPFIFNFPFRLFLFLILNEEQSGSKDQLPPKVRISLWVGFTPNPQSWFKYKTVQKKKGLALEVYALGIQALQTVLEKGTEQASDLKKQRQTASAPCRREAKSKSQAQ